MRRVRGAVIGIVVSAVTLVATPSASWADAICWDGSYSFSFGSGTCSHHGGVQEWIFPATTVPFPFVRFQPPPERSWWDKNKTGLELIGLVTVVLVSVSSKGQKKPNG